MDELASISPSCPSIIEDNRRKDMTLREPQPNFQKVNWLWNEPCEMNNMALTMSYGNLSKNIRPILILNQVKGQRGVEKFENGLLPSSILVVFILCVMIGYFSYILTEFRGAYFRWSMRYCLYHIGRIHRANWPLQSWGGWPAAGLFSQHWLNKKSNW